MGVFLRNHFLRFMLFLGLIGCSSLQIPLSDYAPLLPVPHGQTPTPVDLREIALDVPLGADLGQVTSGGQQCAWPYTPLNRNDISAAIINDDMRDSFDDVLERMGYDVVGNRHILFEDEADNESLRAEYLVGARITSVQAKICDTNQPTAFFFILTQAGIQGELHMRVEWSIYDRIAQKTLLRLQSDGYAKINRPHNEGLALLINQAFTMAAHNLGAQQNFRDAIFYGVVNPENLSENLSENTKENIREVKRDISQDVKLNRDVLPAISEQVPPVQSALIASEYIKQEAPLNLAVTNHAQLKQDKSKLTFQDRVNDIRRGVVLVRAGQGHGSGFFISRSGHIITNAHVVGNARNVRVELSQDLNHEGDDVIALQARVIARDRRRDVALLEILDMPPAAKSAGVEYITDIYGIKPLDVNTTWPAISTDVYVIGAPRTRFLSESVTKGIVSAHRRGFSLDRNRNFIQADVAVHGGNSGGPLLNAQGQVVGVAVSGIDPAGLQSNAGLNLFIPIDEALAALNINITGY